MLNYFSPDVPVLLVGAPGVGKTARVKAHFGHAEIVLTSTLVEEDIGGLPYREGAYDYRTIPAIFRRLNEASAAGQTTVLFLDELDKARRSVADTLLTLVASRQVGNAKLPDDTCIVAAANPPEFGGGDGISEAMGSRFSIVNYVPDIAAWADWASTQLAGASRAIIDAVRKGKMPIFDITGEGLERRITSPRTLTLALRAIDRLGPDNVAVETLINGLLTPAVASQMLYLVRNADNEILDKSVSLIQRSTLQNARQPLRLP